MSRRVRFTTHARREMARIGLSEREVIEVMGGFEQAVFDPESGLVKASKPVRERTVEVIFAARGEALIVIEVRVITQ